MSTTASPDGAPADSPEPVGTAGPIQTSEVAADSGSRKIPPWIRRLVILVLVGVVVLQVSEWLFFNLKGFLGLLFLAWLFAISVEPVVNDLARRGMRRGVATGLVMFGLIAAVLLFLVVFGALLVTQLAQLVDALPHTVNTVIAWSNRSLGTTFDPRDVVGSLHLTPQRISDLAQQLTPGLFGVLSKLMGLVFQGFTLLLFAFYMSAEGPQLRATLSRGFPQRQQKVLLTVWEIAVEKTGGYVVSRLLLAALSAFFTGIFLWILGVPFWLPLAIWTGIVSQFIPTLGTYLAIALPAIIAATQQPLDGVWVVVFGVSYQQLENYVFAPRITARTVAVHPAVAFGSVIVGAALFGPLGALVSIPVIAAIQSVAETYGHRYELSEDVAEAERTRAAPRPPRAPRGRRRRADPEAVPEADRP